MTVQMKASDVEAVRDELRHKAGATGGVAAEHLQSIVSRIERLHAERKALSDDVADIFKEARSAGFDVKALRRVIQLRRMDAADLEEQEALIDLYRHALGC